MSSRGWYVIRGAETRANNPRNKCLGLHYDAFLRPDANPHRQNPSAHSEPRPAGSVTTTAVVCPSRYAPFRWRLGVTAMVAVGRSVFVSCARARETLVDPGPG